MIDSHAAGERRNGATMDRVAIVGMAGIFPGAPDVHRYWQNILARVDATGDPPPEWEAELYLDGESRTDDHPYCVRGGYLGPLAEFSPSALGVMPSSVDGTEPDHFLALRAAYEALGDAGYAAGAVDRTRTEVIIGRGTYVNRGNTTVVQHAVMLDQFLRILRQLHPEHTDAELREIRAELKASLPPFHAETAAGLVPNIISGRIANRLDCMGANYIVDAACASSLVAVDLAMRDLATGRCDLAIAGGVHASTPPPIITIFCQLKAISPKGRIRPFDKEADGTLLGEGVGMVVLKRLADAERDGNRIYAVIRGVGVASDGRAVGLLAPRLEGEELALRRAYESAGVDPATVGLIEAHGTATAVGDAVEIDALSRVFGPRDGSLPRCALGSVKSMIGHLMPASGIAGLIKTTLALHHRVLPPTICESPNEKLGLDASAFYLNTDPRPWIHAGAEPRRAGVNAFGFGGINAHAVLEEYVGPGAVPATSLQDWDTELFLLSARSREDLVAEVERLNAQLATNSGARLKDLAWTINTRAPRDAVRLAIVASSVADLRAKLERAAVRLRDARTRRIRDIEGIYYFTRPLAAEGQVAFVFPGEGSQYPGMLADLCMHFPEVRRVFDFMDRAFADHPRGYLPSDVVFPRPRTAAAPSDLLFGMDGGAEAVFTANQAIAALLGALNVRADAMVGHSTGEHSALLVSRVVTAESEGELRAHVLGVNGVYEQLQSGTGIPEGMLLATGGIDPAVLQTIVGATGGAVQIAMDNCPHQVVLCGSRDAIAAIEPRLAEHMAISQELPFARAYHTSWFDVFCAPLRAYFDRVTVSAPNGVRVYSCVTAARFPDDPDAIRDIVSTQWAKTVRFRETVETMYRDGVRVFVEVGPRSNLTGFIDDTLRGRDYIAVPANVPHRSGVTQLHHLLGQLAAHGVEFDAARLYRDRAPVEVKLDEPQRSAARPRLPLKTGLQPMRLPRGYERKIAGREATADQPAPAPRVATPAPRVAAPAPRVAVPAPRVATPAPRVATLAPSVATPAPRVAPPAPVAPRRAASPAVLDSHFQTMGRFLEVQSRVMSAYLHKQNGRPDDFVVQPAQRTRALPFIDRVQQTGARELNAIVPLDVERHPFFADHTLGRDVSVDDPGLLGLPVLPLTFSIEILAEAAAALVPDRAIASIENIRAYRWITAESPVTLIVSARTADESPDVVSVSARRADASGSTAEGPALIEAAVRFAAVLPPAPHVAPFAPRNARPSEWTPDRLYRDGMFHGPAFRAVRSVDGYGEDGNTATLVAPSPRGLFADGADAELLTEAVLLDAAGQVLAFWAKERLGAHIDVFPFRVSAIRFFQPPPSPGTPVRCDVRASLEGEQQTRCDIDLVDDQGAAICRVEGWEDRRFELPRPALQLRISPRDGALAKSWDAAIAGLAGAGDLACCRVDEIANEFLEANHGIWREMLAHLVLSRTERATWRAMTAAPSRRHEWLLGRAAAKDAVRALIRARFGVAIPPADVEIIPDNYGRPEVRGAWRERLGVSPSVSVAHSGGVAVALAAIDPRLLVGIDIERLSARADGFEQLAFTPEERGLVATLDADARREWHLRMWCAKEAVGKSLGRGLSSGWRALAVTGASPLEGRLTVELRDSLVSEFPALDGRRIETFTTRDGDCVSSAVVYHG